MRVFVAGATGVIGRRVVPLLLAAGHSITAIARSAEQRTVLSRQGVMPVEANLFDAESLLPAVAGHDAEINVATSVPPPSRAFLPSAWKQTGRIRKIGSANLAAAAKAGGAMRFIQESFAPIYADAGDRWIDEESPIRPARYNRTVLD